MGIQNGGSVTELIRKFLRYVAIFFSFRLTSTQNIFVSLFVKMGFLCFARGAFTYADCLRVYARNYTGRFMCVTFPSGDRGRAGIRVNNYSTDETIRDGAAHFACYHLPHRTIVKLQGQETSPFIQGLITNDIGLLEEPGQTAMYAHMLNVQGRTLYDIILYRYEHLCCCLCAWICVFSKPKGVTSYLTKQLLINGSGKKCSHF